MASEEITNYTVETNINKRWEKGMPHHPESVKIMKALTDIDYRFNDNKFDWKMGGDGDNGEELMYEMDIFFEQKDENEGVWRRR